MINNDAEVVASTNLFTEIELTDEQLESICGGIDRDFHRDHDDHGDHRDHDEDRDRDDRRWHPTPRRGYWDRWHHWHWYWY